MAMAGRAAARKRRREGGREDEKEESDRKDGRTGPRIEGEGG